MSKHFNELESILETIQLYIDGVHNGDVDLLRKAFNANAMMYGASPGGNTLLVIEELYGYVSSNKPVKETSSNHQCLVTSIRYQGGAAAVEMEETDAYGFNYLNYFHLLKIDGRWEIVSKLYNGEPL